MKMRLFGKKISTKTPIPGGSDTPSSDQTRITLSSREETTAHALEATIQIIQQVTQFVPLDIAKDILKGITGILILIQKNIQNKTALTGLAQRRDAICSILTLATKDVSINDIGDALDGALRALKSSIDELHCNVKKASQRGSVRRLVGATVDDKQINEWSSNLNDTFTLFSTSVNIVCGIRAEQMYSLLKHRDLPSSKPELPPAPPAIFFGREDLFAEIKGYLLRDEGVALIGPGGIGKSTIARALINDKDIRERYSRRFFVSYDGMDPVAITLGSFIGRIAGALGLPTRNASSEQQVISNLALSPVLIVLDNAETFEDAAHPETAHKISSAVSEITNTNGVTVLLTSRTNRNARGADWIQVEVPPLERVPARQYFRKIYRGDISNNDVDELLGTLDFHPLSIHILAYTARENRWTGEELLDKWQTQHIKILQTGHAKENLGFTVQLSLNSPSVKDLGDNALDVLRIVAFLPQGVNRNHITRLFPSIPMISSLLDTLCKVSLIYRSGVFFTTLAPIRLFLLDTVPNGGLALIEDIRHIYYSSVQSSHGQRDSHANLIVDDHLNIEHLIAYDMKHPPDNIRYVALTCSQFLWGLMYHRLRQTSLTPLISSLPEYSHDEIDSKAWCLTALAELQFELLNFSLSGTTYSTAHTLFIATENHSMASRCISNAAMTYRNRGYYARSLELLENFMRSPSWQHIDAQDTAEIHFTLDASRMHTSRDSADKLFLSSMNHSYRSLLSRVEHWQTRMYHGYSTPEEVEHNLGLIRSDCMTSPNPWNRWTFLLAMAEAAFLRERFDISMGLLNQAHDAVSGDFMLTLMVLYRRAAVASVQGNCEFARSQLQHSLDNLSVVATSSSAYLLEIRYVYSRNEIYTKDYSEAFRLLVAVIADCDITDNIGVKASSMRALGEVQLLLGCKSDSDCSFVRTVELCSKAGVPPELLDVCAPLLKLNDDEYPGWRSFLRARERTIR